MIQLEEVNQEGTTKNMIILHVGKVDRQNINENRGINKSGSREAIINRER